MFGSVNYTTIRVFFELRREGFLQKNRPFSLLEAVGLFAALTSRALMWTGRPRRPVRRWRNRQGKPKTTAPARQALALGPNLPALGFDQLFDNGQAQA